MHGKWEYEVKAQQNHILDILEWPVMEHIYLTDEKTEVLAEAARWIPGITRHQVWKMEVD